jgi:hypothetical protein
MLPATSHLRTGGHVRNAAVLLACLAGVIAISGCGGGGGGGEALSKEDYEAQMQALQEDLSASADQLQQAFSDPQNIDAMSEGLNEAADLLDEASESLGDIAPPDDIADAHQVMVDKSAAAAVKLRDFAETVANASLAELQEKLTEFQSIEEFTELEAAVNEIKEAGYDIGGT